MPMFDKIAENYENLSIAGNELLTNVILNKIFKKLLENDKNLIKKASNISSGTYRILPWVKGKSYNMHDLVWYVDCYLPMRNEKQYNEELAEIKKHANPISIPTQINSLKDKYYTVTLYLLRSLKNGNTSQPVRTLVDMVPVFDASGWRNENPMGSIYTDNFEEFTLDNIKKQLEQMHQAVTAMHPFGELKSFEDISNKVLLQGMSNIDASRTKVFFPNQTFSVKETDSIIAGSCRKWDCGLLEYDFKFKLGNSEYEYENDSYNEDGTVKLSEEMDTNYLSLAKSAFFAGTDTEYSNRQYYLDDSDANIFTVKNGEVLNENGIVQNNVNTKLNTYHGKLDFEIPFIDTNYSIFPVNTAVVVDALGNMCQNENVMVFINKSKKSVTALLVVPNYDQSDYKILGENTFRCRITGRWR